MGQFSWLDCKDGSQIFSGAYGDTFMPIPKRFGGGHYETHYYDGYGHIGSADVYAVVARWNCPKECNGNEEHDRLIGIRIACYDEDNAKLKYPIKITHDPLAVYEDCKPSLSDPWQGWPMDEDEEELEETISDEPEEYGAD